MGQDTHILFDFVSPSERLRWVSIDDGVMGGVSESRLVQIDGTSVVFSGTLSLENSGGFASMRAGLPEGVLEGCGGLLLRALGDGKQFKLNLRTDQEFDGVQYQARFNPPAGEWSETAVPFSAFVPTFRGRLLTKAPQLDPAEVRTIGLMISDRQEGAFRLVIDWIKSYAA